MPKAKKANNEKAACITISLHRSYLAQLGQVELYTRTNRSEAIRALMDFAIKKGFLNAAKKRFTDDLSRITNH